MIKTIGYTALALLVIILDHRVAAIPSDNFAFPLGSTISGHESTDAACRMLFKTWLDCLRDGSYAKRKIVAFEQDGAAIESYLLDDELKEPRRSSRKTSVPFYCRDVRSKMSSVPGFAARGTRSLGPWTFPCDPEANDLIYVTTRSLWRAMPEPKFRTGAVCKAKVQKALRVVEVQPETTECVDLESLDIYKEYEQEKSIYAYLTGPTMDTGSSSIQPAKGDSLSWACVSTRTMVAFTAFEYLPLPLVDQAYTYRACAHRGPGHGPAILRVTAISLL